VLDAPDRSLWDGRYNRAGGRATWYGSSSEAGAWSEFLRSLPDGADPSQFTRRIGRVEFQATVLDLTASELQKRLALRERDLTADDLSACHVLADLAADAGFDGVLAPSAALDGATTVALFDGAIRTRVVKSTDLGVQNPP
jgi:RES domain-containing protein